MKRLYYAAILVLIFSSCELFEGPEKVIWVFPYKLNGSIYSYTEEGIYFLTSDSTELSYSAKSWRRMEEDFEIKGFDFEPGYFYKLLIRSKNEGDNVSLKSILEKEKDFAYRIEGNWIGIPIEGKPYLSQMIISKISRTVEINSACQLINFSLGKITEKKSQIIGSPPSIRSLCGKPAPWDSNSPSGPSIFLLLENIYEYEISQEGYLDFFDAQRNHSLRFRPSD